MCSSMKASSLPRNSLQRSEYSKSMYPSSCALLVGEFPGHLGHRARGLAVFQGLGARGGAVDIALHDALHDAGQAEHVVGEIKIEILRADRLARAFAVAGHIRPLV